MQQHRANWAAKEIELADLLTLLIEDYEAKHYDLPKASPIQAIEFLIDQHRLGQNDLADVFGSATVVLEVLSRSREPDKEQIRCLSKRFQVSPEVFF